MQTAPLLTGAVITAPVSVFPEIQASDIFHRLRPILRSLSRRLAGNRPELREDYFQEGALAVLARLYWIWRAILR
jgi:hypothetical protein